MVGFGGVIVTLWQKDRADRRAELWRRLTWAFEQAVNGDDAAVALGVEAIDIVSGSRLVSRGERSMVLAFLEATLAPVSGAGDKL